MKQPCSAISAATGKPCRHSAAPGSDVCGVHSGPVRAPHKLTPERIAKYLELRRQGALRGEAARAIGVATEAIRKLRHRDPEFEAAEADAEDDALEPLEKKAYEIALAGDRVMLMFLMQNLSGGSRHQYRYRDMRSLRKEVHHTGTVEIESGPSMQRILELQAKWEARRAQGALPSGNVIDAEIVEDET